VFDLLWYKRKHKEIEEPYAFFVGGYMKLFKKRKWTLYLYFNGILVKKIKIDEKEAPRENTYAVNVWFKKQIFKSNKVNVVLKPMVLLKTDEPNRKTYWGAILEEGTEIELED
jgi:hypothetical protein